MSHRPGDFLREANPLDDLAFPAFRSMPSMPTMPTMSSIPNLFPGSMNFSSPSSHASNSSAHGHQNTTFHNSGSEPLHGRSSTSRPSQLGSCNCPNPSSHYYFCPSYMAPEFVRPQNTQRQPEEEPQRFQSRNEQRERRGSEDEEKKEQLFEEWVRAARLRHEGLREEILREKRLWEERQAERERNARWSSRSNTSGNYQQRPGSFQEDSYAKKNLEAAQATRRTRQADYAKWEKKCEDVFRDRATMSELPFPALERCRCLSCPERVATSIGACKHNVRKFFAESGKFSVELIKTQRRLWHPDRFSCCRSDFRAEFKRLANSLFLVLDPLYLELHKKQTT